MRMMKQTLHILRSDGKKMKIWLTETGGHTASEANGLSMREQANLIVRQNVVSFANGIEKVYVYNFTEYYIH